jgi:hypothetical protein
MRDAAKRAGVAPISLRRRVRQGVIPTFEDPLDARTRLVREEDLERLLIPRLKQPGTENSVGLLVEPEVRGTV